MENTMNDTNLEQPDELDPEPAPWGTEENPYPIGTVIEVTSDDLPGPKHLLVDGHARGSIVFVDNTPYREDEVQKRIDAGMWELVDQDLNNLDLWKATINDIRQSLLQHRQYRRRCTGTLLQNAQSDEHGGLSTVYYSIEGSPPKEQAMYSIPFNTVEFYDRSGAMFKYCENTEVTAVHRDSGTGSRSLTRSIYNKLLAPYNAGLRYRV